MHQTGQHAQPPDVRLTAAFDVLLIAAFAGLAAGLAEVVVDAVRRLVLLQIVLASVDVVWAAPAGTLIVLLVPAVCLAPLALALPRVITPRAVTLVWGTVGVFSILTAFRELHPYASLVLALGVGWQLGAAVARHPDTWRRPARRAVLTMAAIAVASGVGTQAWIGLSEARWDRRLPVVPAGAPNILLIILDTVRPDHLSTYGYGRATTPNLDRLAARGVLFENAIAPSSWSLPSHASLFTGHRPGELAARWRSPYLRRHLSFVPVLRDLGYRTAGFTGNHIYSSRESGLAWGFIHYEAYRRSLAQVVLSAALMQVPMVRDVAHARSPRQLLAAVRRFDLARPFEPVRDRKLAPEVRDEFVHWLDRQRGAPFFVFLNFFDAHNRDRPVPPPFDTMFTDRPRGIDRYDQLIARIDGEIGAIVAHLEDRGLLDSTLIIVAADHGEQFGEHGLVSHGNSLYRQLLHVPLLVSWPGHIAPGVRVAAPVALQDVAATLFDVAGLRRPAEIGGQSLAPYWGTDPGPARAVFSEVESGLGKDPHEPVMRGAMRSLVDADWHYIRAGDGTEQLFAWRTDREELHNVAAARPDVLLRLRAAALAVPSSY